MSTIDWPEALIPQAASLQLRKSGRQFSGPFNGTLQTVDDLAERWVLSATLPPRRRRDGTAGVESFCATLAGGVNRVRAWHFGTRGVPAGSLRGAPTLGSAAARGYTSLVLAGCTNANTLIYAGMELDTNSDGLADGWTLLTSGSTGTVTTSRGVGHNSANMQQLAASAMAVGADIGARSSTFAVAAFAGKQVSYSCDVYGAGATSVLLEVLWYDAAGGFISLDAASAALPSTWARVSASFTAPPGAAKAKVGFYVRGGSGALAYGNFDNLQLEIGAATSYAGPATLQADDMISAGGQLFQVAANCTANDAGALTVPLVNRVRGTIASGSAVTWYRPTADFVMPAMQSGTVWQPGRLEGAGVDLVEVW